jgi:hypothetical protein
MWLISTKALPCYKREEWKSTSQMKFSSVSVLVLLSTVAALPSPKAPTSPQDQPQRGWFSRVRGFGNNALNFGKTVAANIPSMQVPQAKDVAETSLESTDEATAPVGMKKNLWNLAQKALTEPKTLAARFEQKKSQMLEIVGKAKESASEFAGVVQSHAELAKSAIRDFKNPNTIKEEDDDEEFEEVQEEDAEEDTEDEVDE